MSVEARWNGRCIARSDKTVMIEGNHYFPAADVDRSLPEPSATVTHYPWKGDASYCTLVVDGERNRDAVWFYSDPLPAAEQIRGRFAFWKGVEVGEA